MTIPDSRRCLARILINLHNLHDFDWFCMYAACFSIGLNIFRSKLDEILTCEFVILWYFVQRLSKRVVSKLPNGSSGDVADLIRVRLLAGWMKRFERYTDRICRVYCGAILLLHFASFYFMFTQSVIWLFDVICTSRMKTMSRSCCTWMLAAASILSVNFSPLSWEPTN